MSFFQVRGQSRLTQGTNLAYLNYFPYLCIVFREHVCSDLSRTILETKPNETMAKVHIPTGSTFQEVAAQLATIGITLDSHQLPDGTYRAYVRQSNREKFLLNLNLNPPTSAGSKAWLTYHGKSSMGTGYQYRKRCIVENQQEVSARR